MAHLYDLDRSMARPNLDLRSTDMTEDGDNRSPRTPTYQPRSPFPSSLSSFNSAKLLFRLTVPLTPKAAAPTKKTVPPPPRSDPYLWVWQCHLCRSKWALGVTRRCLVDGHFYCAGEASQPDLKKKKLQSCSSEFDYVGWKKWGVWKRSVLKTLSNLPEPKGCQRCEFPSQCRYTATERELLDDRPSSSAVTDVGYTSTTVKEDVARYYSKKNVTLKSILTKAEAGKCVQSKMTDFYKADLKRSKSNAEEGKPKGEKIAKSTERRLNPKPALSPIIEDALWTEVGTSLADLAIPLVDFCGHITEKRKSFP